MSGRVVGLVYAKRVGSPTLKAVLAYCAERAGDDGCGIWASKGTMTAALEVDRRTVFRAINELVQRGLLRIAGVRRHINGDVIEYDIDLGALAALEDATQTVEGPVSVRGEPRAPKATANVVALGAQGHRGQDATGDTTPPVAEGHPTRGTAPPPQGQDATQTVLEPSLNRPSNDEGAGARVASAKDGKEAPARIPEDWTLTPDLWAYAQGHGLPEDVIRDEERDFHAYWRDRTDAKARRTASGWAATWRTRVRLIAPRYARRPGAPSGVSQPARHGQPTSIPSIIAAARARGPH